MKNLLKLSGPVFVLVLAATAYAEPLTYARPLPVSGSRNPSPPRAFHNAPNVGNVAPEVDPNLAIGGFTLLAGTLTVMRSRRRS
jgi:hypothetical protein